MVHLPSSWTLLPTLVIGLFLLLPRPSSAAAPTPEPRVDLNRIRLVGGRYRAPLLDAKGDAELTLDPKLQAAAARLLRRARPARGGIILTDLHTGKIVVWAEFRKKGRRSVLLDSSPPAASLFKIVTSAALVGKGHVRPLREVCIDGGHRRIERRHLDPPRTGRAFCTSFRSALGHSRNAVFAQLATHELTRANLDEYATRLGFNSRMDFNAQAFVGRAEIPYNDLEFARTASGFGETTLSPVGAAHLAGIIARAGRATHFNIVEAAEKPAYRAPKKSKRGKRRIGALTAYAVRRMMEVTVHGGTSLETFSNEKGRYYLPNVQIAAKTGTLKPSKSALTTTWFIGFVPSRKPRYVFSVIAQNGPVWRMKANRIARDLLRVVYAHRKGVTSPF